MVATAPRARGREVVAVGEEAARMIGRAPPGTTVVRPIRGGVIADFEATEQMLRAFLAKQTDGFSGAGIEGVCHRTMMEAIATRIGASPDRPDTTGLEISREHLQKVIREIAPSAARIRHE